MRVCYVDESGDLSFNFDTRRTPRHFVVSALICDDEKIVNKIIKRTLLVFDPDARKKRSGKILHANREVERVKQRLLTLLTESRIRSASVVLDKHCHLELIGTNKHRLYTYLVYEALRAVGVKSDDEVFLSRREIKKSLNEEMIMDLRGLLNSPDQKIAVRVHHAMSGLQVVDFVAHTIFRKYENDDKSLWDIIKKKDKTLVAFAEDRPVLLQQGDYLSYFEYSKGKQRRQV